MADEKISALPAAGSLGSTDLVPIVQAGVNLAATAAQFVVNLVASILTSITKGGDLLMLNPSNQIVRANPQTLTFDIDGSIGPSGTHYTLYIGDPTDHAHGGRLALWDATFGLPLTLFADSGYFSTLNVFKASQYFATADPGLNLAGVTNQAGGSVGTLTNAPSAGNPAFWFYVNVNGTYLKVPAWA